MGGYPRQTSDYRNIRCRDSVGNLAFLVQYDFEYWLSYAGVTVARRELRWVTTEGERVYATSITPDGILPVDAVAGPSSTACVNAVAVFESDAGCVQWEFGAGAAAEPSTLALEDYWTLMTCAEKDGETVVVYADSWMRMSAWSSVSGDKDLDLDSDWDPGPAYAWFDSAGGFHALLGELPFDSNCVTHIWRSPGGAWQRGDLCDLTPGSVWKGASCDMSELDEPRFAIIATDGGGVDSVHWLQFTDGAWNDTVLDTAAAGETMSDVVIGGIAGGHKLVVWKITGTRVTETWRYALLSGPPTGPAESGWAIY